MTKEQILSDIESIYQSAIAENKWQVALHAKELQGKALGLFNKKVLPDIIRISDMNENQLKEFIDRLEKRTPALKLLELPEIKNAGKDGGLA
ncbi:MAG: hypothetical protein K2Y18_06760 [Alphaproteobacteria bacterium]|nr:hypothetical protein [Alphaproteobacteria bacterium]